LKLLNYNISDEVFAFSTYRHGGFSKGTYLSFNINPYTGDSYESISKNKDLLIKYLNIQPNQLIIPHQIHETNVLNIDIDFINSSETLKNKLLEGVDILTTELNQYCICISTADCIPILIYDIRNKVASCVHAGWRGTVNRISEKAVHYMEKFFGTNPLNCKAVIGPGISVDNFEVGDEVFNVFQMNGFDMKKISIHKKNKWHINLPECNRIQLLNCGILNKNIINSNICTYSNYKDFFSARRMGVNSGRILTGILIK